MSTNLDINVKHLTRVEGHGNIVVNMKEGVLEKAELAIVEALSLIHISEPTRPFTLSRMPSSA